MSRSFTGAWSQMFLWGSSLVDMHAQCGSMEDTWSEYSISGSAVSNTLHKDRGQALSQRRLNNSFCQQAQNDKNVINTEA